MENSKESSQVREGEGQGTFTVKGVGGLVTQVTVPVKG